MVCIARLPSQLSEQVRNWYRVPQWRRSHRNQARRDGHYQLWKGFSVSQKFGSVLIWLSAAICLWITITPISSACWRASGILVRTACQIRIPTPKQTPDNADDGCPHITAIEKIERISLCLLFFALSLLLLYRRAGKALITGRFFRFIGNFLLGFVCFLLTIEFADSATAFGCSGWRRIWRHFLCAYAEKCGWY